MVVFSIVLRPADRRAIGRRAVSRLRVRGARAVDVLRDSGWHARERASSQDPNLMSKVYFPRLLMPSRRCSSLLVDFAIAFVVLVGMMLVLRDRARRGRRCSCRCFVLLASRTAVGVGPLARRALNVKYRDSAT